MTLRWCMARMRDWLRTWRLMWRVDGERQLQALRSAAIEERRRHRDQLEAERKRLFNEVQRIFAENLPALYFAAPRVYVASSARLINLQSALIRPQIAWSADTLAVRDAAAKQ